MRHGKWRSVAMLLGLALAACGGASNGVTPPSTTTGPGNNGTNGGTGPVATNQVTVGVTAFSPAAVTVPVNTTVTWTWDSCSNDPYYGTTCVSHSVKFDETGGPESQTQSSGTFSRTFTAKGTYTYHCTVHGTSMSGSVVVQ